MTMNAVIANPRNPGVTWPAVSPGLSASSPGAGVGEAARTMRPRTTDAAIKVGTAIPCLFDCCATSGYAKESRSVGGICGYVQGR